MKRFIILLVFMFCMVFGYSQQDLAIKIDTTPTMRTHMITDEDIITISNDMLVIKEKVSSYLRSDKSRSFWGFSIISGIAIYEGINLYIYFKKEGYI